MQMKDIAAYCIGARSLNTLGYGHGPVCAMSFVIYKGPLSLWVILKVSCLGVCPGSQAVVSVFANGDRVF